MTERFQARSPALGKCHLEFVHKLCSTDIVHDSGFRRDLVQSSFTLVEREITVIYSSVGFCHDSDEEIEDSNGHDDLEEEKEDTLHRSVRAIEDVIGFKVSKQNGIGSHNRTNDIAEIVSSFLATILKILA